MKLTGQVLQSFASAKIFHDNNGLEINGIDFTRDGNYLVTSGDDETLHLYDVQQGTLQKTLNSRKYGVSLVRFTHDPSSVICASKNKFDHCVRYWSLHDNRFLRYFKGHVSQVVSLAMSPVNDTFLSASVDGRVMLWDLRSDACQGQLELQGAPSVSFDHPGVCIAAASEGDGLKLFDTRELDKGPFLSFRFRDKITANPRCVRFSLDEKFIAICGADECVHLIDAFQGEVLRTWRAEGVTRFMDLSFSPDSNFLTAGGDNGAVYTYSVKDGMSVEKVIFPPSNAETHVTGHVGAVNCVRWNPKRLHLVSACHAMFWWIPKGVGQ